MNIEDLTIKEVRELQNLCGGAVPQRHPAVGKYVVVRCRDAGVHAGVLESAEGRNCTLRESRRLWAWRVANGKTTLSGVATEGLHPDSRIGAPVSIHLSEHCEIIECSAAAEKSIREAPTDEAR